MPPRTGPRKKKGSKKKKTIDKILELPPRITEDQKEFYLEQINSLELRITRYQKRCDELELMCRAYGDQFETLVKDKRDIATYLKKQLELRNEQVFDLNDRLIGLQQTKDHEKEYCERQLTEMEQRYNTEIERLENGNMMYKTRLAALEEFKQQRSIMEDRIKELEELISAKEEAYKVSLHSMEIALIVFKDRLKKEAIQYLNDLAMQFRLSTKSQISDTIKRAVRENVYLNAQLEKLSSQLEKSIESSGKHREEKDELIRTVQVLEEVEAKSAKKYVASEHIIKILCNKLQQCEEELKEFHQQGKYDREQKDTRKPNCTMMGRSKTCEESETKTLSLTSTQVESSELIFHKIINETVLVTNSEYGLDVNRDETDEHFQNLKEQNHLLKTVIDNAAKAIASVIQSSSEKYDTCKISIRDNLLEHLLSILITAHRLGEPRLTFQASTSITVTKEEQEGKKYNKGLFPATRFGLTKILRDQDKPLVKGHYCRGDLGIVPRDQNLVMTNVEKMKRYRIIKQPQEQKLMSGMIEKRPETNPYINSTLAKYFTPKSSDKIPLHLRLAENILGPRVTTETITDQIKLPTIDSIVPSKRKSELLKVIKRRYSFLGGKTSCSFQKPPVRLNTILHMS